MEISVLNRAFAHRRAKKITVCWSFDGKRVAKQAVEYGRWGWVARVMRMTGELSPSFLGTAEPVLLAERRPCADTNAFRQEKQPGADKRRLADVNMAQPEK